jgi:hypothetical protein
VLERIVFADEEIQNDATPTQNAFSPEAATDEQKPENLPAIDDLAALRKEREAVVTQVVVTGQTSDHSALHQYLVALGESKLLVNPRLERVEGVEADGAGVIRFSARASIRPTYGSPATKEVAPAPATQVVGAR